MIIIIMGSIGACGRVRMPEVVEAPVTTVPITTANSLSSLGVRTDRGLSLTLESVVFRAGSANLSHMSKPQLDQIAEAIRQNRGRPVLIEGHTDNTGDSRYNQTLSERRANAVREALIARGIDAARLTAQGLGETKPVGSNSTSAGRQQNRRVEVIILD